MPEPTTYIAPVFVAGGYRIAEVTETPVEQGVHLSHDFLSAKAYPTFGCCLAAIAGLHASAMARAA